MAIMQEDMGVISCCGLSYTAGTRNLPSWPACGEQTILSRYKIDAGLCGSAVDAAVGGGPLPPACGAWRLASSRCGIQLEVKDRSEGASAILGMDRLFQDLFRQHELCRSEDAHWAPPQRQGSPMKFSTSISRLCSAVNGVAQELASQTGAGEAR